MEELLRVLAVFTRQIPVAVEAGRAELSRAESDRAAASTHVPLESGLTRIRNIKGNL